MSEPIKVGDLVVVVRTDHECANVILGHIFRVLAVPFSHPGVYCQRCKKADIAKANSPVAAVTANGHLPLHWLKRIPPLHELEGEKREEGITA